MDLNLGEPKLNFLFVKRARKNPSWMAAKEGWRISHNGPWMVFTSIIKPNFCFGN